MNFVTTLVGIAHGLIFIPVILAYFGPNVNKALLYEQQQEATKGKDKKYISGPFGFPDDQDLTISLDDFIFDKGRSETMNAPSKKDSMTEMKSKDDYPSETNVKTTSERTEL